MPLEPIGDIANAQMTAVEAGNLIWDTASDWDGAVDEAGVVHESAGGYAGDGTIQLGYPTFDRGGSALEAFYTFNGGSSPVTDLTGNGHDISISGGTFQDTGLHNLNALRMDGSNDYGDISDSGDTLPDPGNAVTVFAVVQIDQPTSGRNVIVRLNQNNNFDAPINLENREETDGERYRWQIQNANIGQDLSIGTAFNSWAGTSTGSNAEGFFNATSVGTASVSASNNAVHNFIGAYSDDGSPGGGFFDGRFAIIRIYTRSLSATEIQALHDTLTGGYLETPTKSFNGTQQPDLVNLDYALNGESIDLKVIGSPGTASEETVTQTMDGATSYALTWGDSHKDFRVRPEFSTTDVTTSPTVTGIELTP